MAIDCINWGGAKTKAGYGMVRLNGSWAYAHRLAYVDQLGLQLQDIKGLVVRHGCDNPSCFNPAHLSLGTQADNMRDKVSRNRHRMSEEAKKNMSEAQARRFSNTPVSALTRERLSAAHKGHRHSVETIEKMRASRIGRTHTEESKARMRASWVARKSAKGVA